jgi:hypothetical protein
MLSIPPRAQKGVMIPSTRAFYFILCYKNLQYLGAKSSQQKGTRGEIRKHSLLLYFIHYFIIFSLFQGSRFNFNVLSGNIRDKPISNVEQLHILNI